MKQHILAALQEEFEAWQELLAGMSGEQITDPLLPQERSTKDIIAHLWAWQQRSIARVEAVVFDREPRFPNWPGNADPDADGTTDQINEWIFITYRGLAWEKTYQNWKEGFHRFLAFAEQVPEMYLLDGGRYPWLQGYPLALILLASYDHHQEHYEKLQAWLKEHRKV